MTKPSYEERRITKHSGSTQIADSASDSVSDQAAREIRFCEEHGTERVWAQCWNCEDGYSDHDCGEDCCACLYPEDNVECDNCDGECGYYLCPVCAPDADF